MPGSSALKEYLKRPCIAMIGPSLQHARGGMASVVLAYKEAGLFSNWPILYLETHKEISAVRKLLLGISSFCRFVYLLIQGRVGLLHIHVAGQVSFLRKSAFMLAADLFGVPYILHLHGSAFRTFYDTASGKLIKKYIRYVFDRATFLIALSDEWRQWLSGITTNRNIRLIFNPVNLPDEFTHDDSSNRILNIVFLGKLTEKKGIADLLKAYALVLERSSVPTHLYCGGDGDRLMVDELIRDLSLNEYVSLLGWIQGEAKHQLLNKADALVLPSYNEVLPMSILEALAYGVPVVATRVGAIADAVSDGVEGLLVSPGDIHAIADAILTIVTNAETRKFMRKNARAKADNCFNDKAVISEISQLYTEILGDKYAQSI
ncbi:glycosyltransferase family 4 protein [Methylomonas lenta]|nr:glycosyltransferase family 4 protein [Methylomonas lenta]